MGGGRKMTPRASWLVAFLALAVQAKAAFEAAIPDAGQTALGGNLVAWSPEGGSKEANPALSAAGKGWFAGAGLTHPLGLTDLDLSGLWAGRSRSGWIPGFAVRWKSLRAGKLYAEDGWDLDVGTGDGNWQAGAGWRWGRVGFTEGGSDWIQGIALGIVAKPHPLLAAGLSWEDASLMGATDARMVQPWLARAGLVAAARDSNWVSNVSLEKRQDKGLSWAMGQELRWQVLRLRAGARLEPWTLALGAGVRWQGFGLDWAQEGDPRLGWQQHWTISVER
jgi:hypothetical protein